jgi:hypothetical protein
MVRFPMAMTRWEGSLAAKDTSASEHPWCNACPRVKPNRRSVSDGGSSRLKAAARSAPRVLSQAAQNDIPAKMLEEFRVTEDNWRDALADPHWFGISESPSYLGRGVAALAADDAAARFAGKILTSRDLADTYGVTDIDGSRPDCWGLIDKYGIDHHSDEGFADR